MGDMDSMMGMVDIMGSMDCFVSKILVNVLSQSEAKYSTTNQKA